MIGFGLPKGQYIAVQAVADGSEFACQYSENNSTQIWFIYNRNGEQTGTKVFDQASEMTAFMNSLSAAMLDYNGQVVYFEPSPGVMHSDDWVVIP